MIVTLSLHRHETLASRLWAFGQMGLARAPLKRVAGLRTWKLMGTGAGDGFSTTPNFSVYALLCVWDDEACARAAMAQAEPFQRLRRHAHAFVTLTLEPTQSRGKWAGEPTFGEAGFATPTGLVVALTRATVKPARAFEFWSKVPAISDAILEQEARHFMIGMGEVPWLHQVTFSIWSDEAAMRDFSLRSRTHGEAVKLAYTRGWFSEYLFARFNLMAVDGRWPALDEVLARLGTDCAEPAPHVSGGVEMEAAR
ncbi:MAG: spheroidene monooxygenase [Rhizobiaceae bacterium]|jgi:spheroidene monooxygenase|nr:spheroidene monooxygenase [Rhizobiaceae bacterium]